MNISEGIENLYSVFNKYTTSDLHYCDCGCINPENVRKLASKKLRDLEEDDFVAYHGSALYTWGDVEHYKHFLPRILEVYRLKNGNGLIGLYEITTKLEYAEWQKWDELEKEAIKDFILLDWIELVNRNESEIDIYKIHYYSFFLDVKDLFRLWSLSENGYGLRNFVNLYYYFGYDIVNKGFVINKKTYDSVIKEFIGQKDLVNKLEKEFFKYEIKDSEYAEKVSAVLQMIESYQKLKI